jgi:ketosteroid isomerase-like protein
MRSPMKKTKFLLALILALTPLIGMASESGDIRKIIGLFGEAIKKKDKEAFMSLFIDGDVSWIGVFSTKEFQKFSGKEGMPGKIFQSIPNDFMDWVVSLEGTPREDFKDIVVNDDGEVASVYFNYSFYIGEEIQNWGAESWLLVKSELGWRIQAVNFSYTSNK